MLLHTLAYCLFQLGCLEQCRSIGDASDRLVRLEHVSRHFSVDVLAGFDIETKATKHEGDEAAGAGSGDQVEVVAWFGNLLLLGCFAFAFDICPVHELLEDDEHREASDAAAI